MRLKLLFILLVFISGNYYCQNSVNDTLFVGFWNTENLFDWIDDPVTNDSDFTPSGRYNWTEERYEQKIKNIAQVINDMNNGNGPDILGMAEVEHKTVLDNIIQKYLNVNKYKSIEFESPDIRGIDCAMLYNSKDLLLISAKPDTIILSSKYKTRAILEAAFVTKYSDTLHIFVNHFPSRRGGQDESVISRIEAAKVLKYNVDKLLNQNASAKIIIVGDFNDQPSDTAISYILNALPVDCNKFDKQELYNLDYPDFLEKKQGTYSYRGQWNFLDQIIVSGGLFLGDITYICSSFKVFNKEYLFEKEGKYKGTPFPTFGGKKYLGGYSDHLPVTAKFLIKTN